MKKVIILLLIYSGTIMAKENFEIKSTDFQNENEIPKEFTCQGNDISPELKWQGIPQNTKSFALICDDPDAPTRTWTHWVIYNIPAQITSLSKNFTKEEKLADGTCQGINDFKKIGYNGPCPPAGKPHRYYFKLYALNKKLNLEPGLTKKQLLQEMEGSIIEQTQIMGIYKRQ